MTNTISIINRNLYQRFPFHLVDPSNWPILVSFSLLNLTVGAVAYMHGYPNGGSIFLLGLILTVAGMVLWFRDIITEGTYLGCHTSEVQKGLIIGFILFDNNIIIFNKNIPSKLEKLCRYTIYL